MYERYLPPRATMYKRLGWLCKTLVVVTPAIEVRVCELQLFYIFQPPAIHALMRAQSRVLPHPAGPIFPFPRAKQTTSNTGDTNNAKYEKRDKGSRLRLPARKPRLDTSGDKSMLALNEVN